MPRIYAKDNVTTAKPDMITATDVGTKRALDVNVADGDITLNAADLELGAVELKDATTDTRAVVDSNGNLGVFQCDESGNIIGGTTPQNVTLATALDSDTDSVTNVNQPAASLGHGVKNVTTAGTDVALAASTPIKYVVVQARYENTSVIAVGGSGVDATATTGTGIILEPGDSIALDVDNLTDVYIDSRVSNEGVRFTYGVA